MQSWYFNWNIICLQKGGGSTLETRWRPAKAHTVQYPCRALPLPLSSGTIFGRCCKTNSVPGSFAMWTITPQKPALLFFIINNYYSSNGALQIYTEIHSLPRGLSKPNGSSSEGGRDFPLSGAVCHGPCTLKKAFKEERMMLWTRLWNCSKQRAVQQGCHISHSSWQFCRRRPCACLCFRTEPG